MDIQYKNMFSSSCTSWTAIKGKFCLSSSNSCYLERVERMTFSIPSLVLWVPVLKFYIICWKDDVDTVMYHVTGKLRFQCLSIMNRSTGFQLYFQYFGFFPLYMNILNSSCLLLRQKVLIDGHFFFKVCSLKGSVWFDLCCSETNLHNRVFVP